MLVRPHLALCSKMFFFIAEMSNIVAIPTTSL